MWEPFVFVIFRSRLLSSIPVHIHSSSALFVGAINLAKGVVGNFHLLWIVRALANWQGGGYLRSRVLPLSLHGYSPQNCTRKSLCNLRTLKPHRINFTRQQQFLTFFFERNGDKGRIGSYTKLCDFTLLFMILQVELRLNKGSLVRPRLVDQVKARINNDDLRALKRLARGSEWSPSKCT
jgi:hypothetical protein